MRFGTITVSVRVGLRGEPRLGLSAERGRVLSSACVQSKRLQCMRNKMNERFLSQLRTATSPHAILTPISGMVRVMYEGRPCQKVTVSDTRPVDTVRFEH